MHSLEALKAPGDPIKCFKCRFWDPGGSGGRSRGSAPWPPYRPYVGLEVDLYPSQVLRLGSVLTA